MRVIQCIIRCRTQAYYAYPIKAPVVVAANAVLLLPAVPGMLEAIPNKFYVSCIARFKRLLRGRLHGADTSVSLVLSSIVGGY